MTSITEIQIALTRRRVNFMPIRPCSAARRTSQCTVRGPRARRDRGDGAAVTARPRRPAGSTLARGPRGDRPAARAPGLQVVDREDGSADRVDLARGVLLRAPVP